MSDDFIFLNDVQYNRNYYTNQTNLQTNNGISRYRVPVNKKPLNSKINEIEVIDLNWIGEIETTIINRCKTISDRKLLKEVFEYARQLKTFNLANLNQSSIIFLANTLFQFNKNFKYSDKMPSNLKSGDRLIDLCVKSDADIYLNGSGSKYISESAFYDNNIKITELKFTKNDFDNYLGLDSDISILSLIADKGLFYTRESIINFASSIQM